MFKKIGMLATGVILGIVYTRYKSNKQEEADVASKYDYVDGDYTIIESEQIF